MDLDLKGRINNTKLPLSHGLHPVFEAISNSIHAIEETPENRGEIEVEIIRDTSQGRLIEGEPLPNQPIIGFVVHDDGIGFTDDHFKSFKTSDTTTKRSKGGKGVGRFLWLIAFNEIEVVSVFCRNRTLMKRTFEFRLSDRGIEKEELVEVTDTPRKTTIRLNGFKPEYRKHPTCPKSASTVARRIVEHFLEFFILDTCPKIVLRDNYEQTDIDLNRMFSTEMRLDSEHKEFQVKGQKFRITHVRLLAPPDTGHVLSFCANDRPVKTEPLPKLLANLETVLTEPKDERKFFYAGYVSGQALDASANDERTRFDMLDPAADSMFPNELSWQDIRDAAVAKARSFLEPYTQPLNKAKKERIKEFVSTKAP